MKRIYTFKNGYGKLLDYKEGIYGVSRLWNQLIHSVVKTSEVLDLTAMETILLMDEYLGGEFESDDELVRICVRLDDISEKFINESGLSGGFIMTYIVKWCLVDDTDIYGMIKKMGDLRKQLMGQSLPVIDERTVMKQTSINSTHTVEKPKVPKTTEQVASAIEEKDDTPKLKKRKKLEDLPIRKKSSAVERAKQMLENDTVQTSPLLSEFL